LKSQNPDADSGSTGGTLQSVGMYIYIYIYIHIKFYKCVHKFYLHIDLCVYSYTYMHKYAYTYTSKYTQTHIPASHILFSVLTI
jgi:hypothetical protein